VKSVTALLAAALFCSVRLASAAEAESYDELGQALLSAVQQDDIVAFSGCWMSHRQSLHLNEKYGKPIDAETKAKLFRYNRVVNRAVAKAFKDLQEIVKSSGIKPTELELKSIEAHGLRELTGIEKVGSVKKVGGFDLVFTAGETEFTLEIDDGVQYDGLWYFTDAPINIRTPTRVYDYERAIMER
jgi:hypothetical protein